MQNVSVAIVGSTGLVGQEIIKILTERLGSERLKLGLFASRARPQENVRELDTSWEELKTYRFILNATEDDVALKLRKHLQPGQILIDNSSAFRMDADVPLVVPEVNGELLKSQPAVVANPNCTAALLCVAVSPLKKYGLQRLVVSTYQSASGVGLKGLEELESQALSKTSLPGVNKTPVFGFHLMGNILSHNTSVRLEGEGAGYNGEELKVIAETQKILGLQNLAISATCVRVPVRRAHTESVTLDLRDEISLEALRLAFVGAPGIKLVDDWKENHFPMPLETQGQDLVFVGRLRKDPYLLKTVHLFLSGDQLRKGAATNAVQILEAYLR